MLPKLLRLERRIAVETQSYLEEADCHAAGTAVGPRRTRTPALAESRQPLNDRYRPAAEIYRYMHAA